METESEAVNALMDWWEGADVIEPESHYNHFGDRGVVDLYVESKNQAHLHELKSEAAVKSASGVNEIVRQFNRMREYYFRDESNPRGFNLVSYRLYFLPSDFVIQHLRDNLTVYTSLQGTETEEVAGGTHKDIAEVRLFDGRTTVPVKEGIVNSEQLIDSLDSDYPISDFLSKLE